MLDTIEKPTFIDYLKGGMQINLCVAIDYTASNGEMSQASSLHFLGA
jgi:copine 5/8/9